MNALRLAAFGLAGLIFGSFLTIVVYRAPRGKSVALLDSACPWCGMPIRPRDTIPMVSYLLLRGRCRTCRARISAIYPMTEAITAALFVAAALTFESLYLAATFSLFLAMLLALALTDLQHRRVPNAIVYPSLLLFGALLVIGATLDTGLSLARAAVGFMAFGGGFLTVLLLTPPSSMGMGDVKLAALIGLVLSAVGWRYLVIAVVVGVLSGGVGAIIVLVIGSRLGSDRHLHGMNLLIDEPRGLLRASVWKAQLPYGPFLVLGAVVATLWGPQIWSWYVGSGR